MNAEVAQVLGRINKYHRPKLLKLRELILSVAAKTPKVGPLDEVIRWRQVSFITSATGSGSIIRIGVSRTLPGCVAIYFHCQTTLVSSIRSRFGDKLRYEGNRAVLLPVHKPLPIKTVEWCIRSALTYNVGTANDRIPIGNLIK